MPATTIFRVATNNTVKIKNRRIQGFWKNFSCPFVTSNMMKRPPKLRVNIIRPIKYGLLLNTFAKVSIGDGINVATAVAAATLIVAGQSSNHRATKGIVSFSKSDKYRKTARAARTPTLWHQEAAARTRSASVNRHAGIA